MTIMRDEMFGKLRTVFCINVLHILVLDILRTMGSMNPPRSKGKYDASVVRMVTSSEGSKYVDDLTQLETKVSLRTRWAMWG